MVTLQAELQAICHDYFPRWQRMSLWRLRHGARGSWVDSQGRRRTTCEWGFCDSTTQRIFVAIPRRQPLERQHTIIHELCHAVTGRGHQDSRFLARLRQAASRATALGEPGLAQALEEEAERYAMAPRIRGKGFVYGMLEDWISESPPGTFTLEQLIDALADLLVSTPEEIRARYPRLATVYTRAVKAVSVNAHLVHLAAAVRGGGAGRQAVGQ